MDEIHGLIQGAISSAYPLAYTLEIAANKLVKEKNRSMPSIMELYLDKLVMAFKNIDWLLFFTATI